MKTMSRFVKFLTGSVFAALVSLFLLAGLIQVNDSSLIADDVKHDYRIKTARFPSRNVAELFPAREKVEGLLWDSMEYTPGMTKLLVSCGVDRRAPAPPGSEKEEQRANFYRVEYYRYNDDDEWGFVEWYKFDSVNGLNDCENLLSQAKLLNGSNRLHISLLTKSSRMSHGSVVKSWQLK